MRDDDLVWLQKSSAHILDLVKGAIAVQLGTPDAQLFSEVLQRTLALIEDFRRSQQVLDRIQWSAVALEPGTEYYLGNDACPLCANTRDTGHSATCGIARALRE